MIKVVLCKICECFLKFLRQCSSLFLQFKFFSPFTSFLKNIKTKNLHFAVRAPFINVLVQELHVHVQRRKELARVTLDFEERLAILHHMDQTDLNIYENKNN